MLENETNKKSIISIILSIIVIFGIITFIVYLIKPKYTVKVNNTDGIITKKIVVKNNRIRSLPISTIPRGKKLITWVNDNNESVRPNLKLKSNIEIKPIFDNTQKEFVTNTHEIIPDISLPKADNIIMPVKPSLFLSKFQYWVDKDGIIYTKNDKIDGDITLYARYLNPLKKKITIKFNTGTKEKIKTVKINKNDTLAYYRLNTLKEGYVFNGWLDENNKPINNKEKIKSSMTVKANWKKSNICPKNCKLNEDKTSCNLETYASAISENRCPDGSFLYKEKCITKTGGALASVRSCSTLGDEVLFENYCMKVVKKIVNHHCPEGFSRIDDQCKKIKTIKCTPN